MAGPPPRYGTWITSTPVIDFSISTAKWCPPPVPLEEKVSLPGLARASAITSCTEFAGSEACATSIAGRRAARPTGLKSLYGSYPTAPITSGALTITAPVERNSVYPSGGALATISAAITPPPPPRLSMTTGCPHALTKLAATGLATASVPPPGGYGVTRRTGLTGNCSASDAFAHVNSASAKTADHERRAPAAHA